MPDLFEPDPDARLADDQIVLRRPTAADAPAVGAMVRASHEHLAPWMPWATADYDETDAMMWIERRLDATAHPFAIVADNDRIVGTAGLNRIDGKDQLANLGYWLRPDATGQGAATRAANLLIDHGIRDLGLARLEILMSVENEPSRAVAERSKASYEGIQRGRLRLNGRQHDAHCYVALARDW